MKLIKIGDFLKRSKIPIDIEDEIEYKRVTIRINHNGVSLRDSEFGKLIGTKKQFILKAGQFIVSKIDARYGAFGIAPNEVDNAIITGNFWAYDVDTNLINIDWFNQFTNSPVFYDVCERASSGITHRKYLDEKFFLNYQILLPSVEEQLIQIEKINSQKVSFGELSTELTHQLTLVKKLRQQLLQDAVQGKLLAKANDSVESIVPPDKSGGDSKHQLPLASASGLKDKFAIGFSQIETGQQLLEKIKAEKQKLIAEKKLKKEKELPPIKPEEIPFEIPDNWVWCRLGEITKVKVGSTPSRDNPMFWNGDIPWVSSGAVANNYIYDTKEKITKLGFDSTSLMIYPKGSVLVAMIGQGKTRGQTSILKIDATINQNVAGLVIEHNYLLSEFLWYFFLSRYEITREGASGGNQPALNGVKISNTTFPIPPMAEQHRIVQKLDELMQYCDELEASIKASQAQNEKLLQQVLREALRKEPVEV